VGRRNRELKGACSPVYKWYMLARKGGKCENAHWRLIESVRFYKCCGFGEINEGESALNNVRELMPVGLFEVIFF
jgi:hypothetical protein